MYVYVLGYIQEQVGVRKLALSPQVDCKTLGIEPSAFNLGVKYPEPPTLSCPIRLKRPGSSRVLHHTLLSQTSPVTLKNFNCRHTINSPRLN